MRMLRRPLASLGREGPSRPRLAVGTPVLAVLAIAVALAGCAAVPSARDEKIRLTVATFGDFGYTELLEQYMAENPNIEIVERLTEYNAHHTQLATQLAAGHGAADVVAIAEDFISKFTAQPQNFYDLMEYGAADLEANFLPWKWEQTKVGEVQIGLGTDVGGLAICYRRDLFEEAGLPSDRVEVAALWPDWESFIETGNRFEAAGTDAHFFDSGALLFNAIIGQAPELFYDRDGNLIVETNPAIKEAWDLTIEAVEAGQSAELPVFSPAWTTGFQEGSFALITCPAWMMAFIQGLAPETSGLWDVAAVPVGGGNWGGSWLTVPTHSDHPQEAFDLAAWLTSADQALAIFKTIGNVPPLPALYEDPAMAEFTNPFFNNAPVGQIFSSAAAGLTPQPQGPQSGAIRVAIQSGIERVGQGTQSPEEAWQRALHDAIQAAGQ